MKYYLLTKNWTYRGNFVLTFWCENRNGYTYFKKDAGLYEYEDAFSIAKGCNYNAFPLPQDVVDTLWTKVVYEPSYTPQDREAVINNCHTRSLLKINPFDLSEGERVDHRSFIVKGECDWLHTKFEEIETVKSDWWDITINEPSEPSDYGIYGSVEGKTYREARKKAFKVVDSDYCDCDFILTMGRFKIKRSYIEQLKTPIVPETWEVES